MFEVRQPYSPCIGRMAAAWSNERLVQHDKSGAGSLMTARKKETSQQTIHTPRSSIPAALMLLKKGRWQRYARNDPPHPHGECVHWRCGYVRIDCGAVSGEPTDSSRQPRPLLRGRNRLRSWYCREFVPAELPLPLALTSPLLLVCGGEVRARVPPAVAAAPVPIRPGVLGFLAGKGMLNFQKTRKCEKSDTRRTMITWREAKEE